MTDLKDYLPDEIIFKLPTTVKFPEVIFPDCICMDDVKKKSFGTFCNHPRKGCNC